MNDLVSIVIPVFNAENYIENCVKDLMEQSHKHIEIILVDDGSTDNTGLLCDSLASSVEIVKCYHQKNMGVSSARNLGTEMATGDFIIYMDADDFLVHNAISNGLSYINRFDVEMVVAREIMLYPGEKLELTPSQENGHEVLESKDFDELRKTYLGFQSEKLQKLGKVGELSGRPCERLIRADIAKDILFPVEVPLGEDKLWNLRLLNKCKKVCVLGDCWYQYMIYPDSAVRCYHGNRREKGAIFIKSLYIENKKFCNEHRAIFLENIAIMLYCIAFYDLNSKDCPMSNREKIQYMAETIKDDPWRILWKGSNSRYLTFVHRAMLLLYKKRLWIIPLKIYKYLKSLKWKHETKLLRQDRK